MKHSVVKRGQIQPRAEEGILYKKQFQFLLMESVETGVSDGIRREADPEAQKEESRGKKERVRGCNDGSGDG